MFMIVDSSVSFQLSEHILSVHCMSGNPVREMELALSQEENLGRSIFRNLPKDSQ